MLRHRLGALGPCVLVLATACGGCGSDEEPATQATAPTADSTIETAGEDEGASGGDPDRPAGAADGASSPEPGDQDGSGGRAQPGGCSFDAPPGRLASDQILIELSGADCEQGRRLAEAASVGQPAGANIPVRRDGFECAPSTRERGVNVDYSCENGSEAVSFRIEWTTEP